MRKKPERPETERGPQERSDETAARGGESTEDRILEEGWVPGLDPGELADSWPDETGAPPAPAPATPEAAAAEYLDRLQRLQAEFDNYRKRIRREQEDWSRLAQADVMLRLLPVLDDLRRAREHVSADAPDASGLLLILKRLEDELAKSGLEEQKADPGTRFDPEQHEALLVVPSREVPEGAIVQVLEPGYLFKGKLLRRSKVSCSTGPAPE